MREYFVKVVAKGAMNKVFIHAKVEDVFDDLEQLKRLLEKNTTYFVYVYRNDFPSYDYVDHVIEVKNLSKLIDAVKNANIKIRGKELAGEDRTLVLPLSYEVKRVTYSPSNLYGNKTFIEIQKVDDPFAGVNMTNIALQLHASICRGNVVSLIGNWRKVKEIDPLQNVYKFYYDGD